MNNFLCLCFLCPLSCYFFPPGLLPFLMQISPPRLPHLSLFYVPPLSLVIITEYCSGPCFGICHDNILQFVPEKNGRKRIEVKPSDELGMFEVTRLFSDQEPRMWLKSSQNSRCDPDWSDLPPVWCGWFRHMFLPSTRVLVSHSASHLGVDLLVQHMSNSNLRTSSDVNSSLVLLRQVHTNLMEEHSGGLTRAVH